jgi:large subunit ribosomal protein L9
MKVILLRDVARIGKRFEIKEVPNGFALNKLIPDKDAELATPANIKRIQEKKRQNDKSSESEIESIKALAELLTSEPLKVEMEANEQEHLFKSVQADDVVMAGEKRGVNIPKDKIKLPETIKSLGKHEVKLVGGKEEFAVVIEVIARQK